MIRRHMIMSAAVATMALSSCGGGNDNSSATPTPTTTPTPTPTASPTYAAFPLAAAAEFNTINATTSYTGDPAGAVTLGVAGTESLTTRVRLATDSAITTGTYVARENTEESRFTNTNVVTAPTPAAPEFVFRSTSTATGALAGNFAQLEFLNNTIPSQVTSDTGLAFTNSSYAAWWRGDSTAGAKRLTYTVFGYNTVTTDMPTSGTTSYASRVAGRLVSVAGTTTSVRKVTGTITTTVNFSTGLVSLTLALSTIPADGGAAVPYGTITGQGAISVGNNQFTGSFTTGSPLSGTFAGAFYGSAAKEIGISFAGSGTVGGADQRLVGVVLGKK